MLAACRNSNDCQLVNRNLNPFVFLFRLEIMSLGSGNAASLQQPNDLAESISVKHG
jgi:hypothetical protein